MAKTPWIPAALALTLALGLAGCGESDEEAAAPTEADAPVTEAEPGLEANDEEPTTPPPAAEEEADTADESLPGVPEEETTLEPGEEIEADTDTLGESPVDTLEEGGALPGEPTRSDIDAILEDTERRFEEAQRQIDQQFEEVERDSPVLEPMEGGADFEPSLEPMEDGEAGTTSDIEREAERTGEVTQSDVDAWLEETERRFEEAQRQLDEQFREAEQSDPRRGSSQLESENE
ncbi:MAG: hypothetical protein LPK20_07940 [Halomonas sp.]|uniref:Lipoprotein n=1 Tax=Billgrantia tianxiuensis TaxID=2497861 RepID=A0A6I6SMI0_9GAMM|nr:MULTISPECIES: hypothetical protein [Halomonas]MCE8034379.1 hypothetical protein [Halomonas sp. MCCC 1A11057]MDX5433485.1 hypothetical protein [Halomonas sp.]QHC50832.1 hypothetical protein EKK97_16330 [Halomonas tianxiuensis]